MTGRRQVKEGFLSLETIETWIVYVCHSEGEQARQNIYVPLNRGMVVGARHTGLCQELQGCIGVNMGQHPCGTHSTPCRIHAPTNWGCSEGKRGWVQLNIRKGFIMSGLRRAPYMCVEYRPFGSCILLFHCITCWPNGPIEMGSEWRDCANLHPLDQLTSFVILSALVIKDTH